MDKEKIRMSAEENALLQAAEQGHIKAKVMLSSLKMLQDKLNVKEEKD